MTSKRQRKKIARQLPPVGTTLTARSKGQAHGLDPENWSSGSASFVG